MGRRRLHATRLTAFRVVPVGLADGGYFTIVVQNLQISCGQRLPRC